MSPLNGELTARGLSNDLVLPFLLIWYGWLSKEQGTIAKKRGLIIIKHKASAASDGRRAYLTKRGNRKLKTWLVDDLDRDMAYAYATYLRKYGKVGVDRWCLYAGSPLGVKSNGFDWYHSKELRMS